MHIYINKIKYLSYEGVLETSKQPMQGMLITLAANKYYSKLCILILRLIWLLPHDPHRFSLFFYTSLRLHPSQALSDGVEGLRVLFV